jgi:hypothetical protein
MTGITNYKAYKREIVDKDHVEFLANGGDVRAAFHSAISLFHLHDWVYDAHKAYIDANFTFLRAPAAGSPPVATAVTNSVQFAHALSDVTPEFALIRGVANSAKHLTLHAPDPKRPPLPPNAPSHAANTQPRGGAVLGQATFNGTTFNGSPQVMLEGANNKNIVLTGVTSAVMKMWQDLFKQHGW